MKPLIPQELSETEQKILEELLAEVRADEFEIYLEKAQIHVRDELSGVDGETGHLAAKILDVLFALETDWDQFQPEGQKLLCAAIRYFSRSYDEIIDFDPEIGLEDDVAVLNACLKAVGRGDLVMKID